MLSKEVLFCLVAKSRWDNRKFANRRKIQRKTTFLLQITSPRTLAAPTYKALLYCERGGACLCVLMRSVHCTRILFSFALLIMITLHGIYTIVGLLRVPGITSPSAWHQIMANVNIERMTAVLFMDEERQTSHRNWDEPPTTESAGLITFESWHWFDIWCKGK